MTIESSSLRKHALWGAVIALTGLDVSQTFAQSTHYAKPGITVDIPSAVAISGAGTQNVKIHLSYAFLGRETAGCRVLGQFLQQAASITLCVPRCYDFALRRVETRWLWSHSPPPSTNRGQTWAIRFHPV